MEDGVEVVDGSQLGENKLAEDKVSDKNALMESNEARNTEDEVVEGADGSRDDVNEQRPKLEADGLRKDSAVEEAKKKFRGDQDEEDFEDAMGDLNELGTIDDETNDSKVDNLLVAETVREVKPPHTANVVEAESDFVTPKINGDTGESEIGDVHDAEVAFGQAESNLNVVDHPEKVGVKGSGLVVQDLNMLNGVTHSHVGNGIDSPMDKELKPEVTSKTAGPKESRNDGIENGRSEERFDVSAGTQVEQQAEKGEGMNQSYLEKDLVSRDSVPKAERNSETDASSRNEPVGHESAGATVISQVHDQEVNSGVKSISGDKILETDNSTEIGKAGRDLSEKPSSEKKEESKDHCNGLKQEHYPGSSSSSISNNSAVSGENCREHEIVQSDNGGHDAHHNSQVNSKPEQKQKSGLNIESEIKEIPQVKREPDVQQTVNSAPLTESSSNPTESAPARPAGLGRAAPLLEPAQRVPQQPRVNGNMSHIQTQQAEDSSTADTDEHDETREKLQMIRVKFLRLAHRLGQTPHNVVVAQVLYRLGLAEQLRGRNGSRVGAFSFDRASAMAEQVEAAGQDPLDFSCTIMVLGKSGVGKSATINSIFDEVKFCTDAFQMGTNKVQDVEGFVQGIKVRVIDTPGLLPSWSDQRQNEKILTSVKNFIKKTPPDIVLYLDRLDMQSRDSGDMPLLRTITDIFGPSIWFNAIVVLTHAASAPPDGPNGVASSYDMFVTQRSHVIQQAIRQAAGDMRLMNPVSLVENHSACRTNRAGQRVLPNGQVWKPHLLLLSFASKILAEANALLKLQDNIPGRPFTARSKAPPLPFLLTSLLQSRPHVKLPAEQYDEENEDDLGESSDSDEEAEYDQLPPFKRLTNDQMAKLSRSQKKLYLDELGYREKLFMKKQMKEERRRRKMLKRLAAEIEDLPNEHSENTEEESGGPASVPVPMPDLSLPASFDSDNPTHRYRYLDSSSQWLVRPVLETHGWDHDVGYEGVNAEKLFVVKDKIPISFSGQVTKDKKDANLQLEMASSVKHGEARSTSLGFDMQTVGKELAYTLRSEMKFNNFRRNKAAAGLSVTLLGDSVSAGVKVEDKLIANRWFRMVVSGGAMTGRGDVAYGGSLEAQLRDKDYPLGRFLSTLGLSVMDWHGDLAIGGNIQSQLPIGRSSNLIARANVNNRGAGQLSLRLNSSEQLQLAMVAIVPLFKKFFSYPQQTQYGQ